MTQTQKTMSQSGELTVIDNIITNAAEKFVSTISQYKWNLIPDSQLQAAKQAITKNAYIMKVACDNPESVHDSLLQSAILGLDLTPGKRQGWLLPRKSQMKDAKGNYITNIQLQVGYKGVEAIHQKLGVIDRLSVQIVREHDVFEWSGNDQEKPKHEANWFADIEERGPVKGAFIITYFPDKTIQVIVTSIEVIYKNHRDRSDAWKNYTDKLKKGEYAYPPPWVTDEEEMIKKTMTYIASKQWPANIRDQDVASNILSTLYEIDIADYSQKYTSQQKEWYDHFLDQEDALGLYLFERRADFEVQTALFNSFPKGQKVKLKEKVRGLTKLGGTIYDVIIANLGHDDMAVLEQIEGISENTMTLLKAQLNPDQQSHLQTVLEGNIKAITA